MPVLDRYLEAMSKQRAEALVFKTGAPVEMVTAGGSRPVSSRPATAEQISGLISEIVPDFAESLRGGAGEFPYDGQFGPVVISVLQGPQGFSVRIRPGSSTAPSPSPSSSPSPSHSSPSNPASRAPSHVSSPSPSSAPAHSPAQPTPQPLGAMQLRPASSRGGTPHSIEDLFHQMLDLKASDLHLKSGKVPMTRVDGSMAPLPDRPVLSGEDLGPVEDA